MAGEELSGRRAARAGQERAALSSPSLVLPGCGRSLPEDRGREAKPDGGVERTKTTGGPGKSGLVSISPAQGADLPWRRLISDKNEVTSSSRLCPNLACHSLAAPRVPAASSGSAGQVPRMQVVTELNAIGKRARC